MREEEFVFLNNWHFANRLPYSANDVRSMMHDCLSLLIDQVGYHYSKCYLIAIILLY